VVRRQLQKLDATLYRQEAAVMLIRDVMSAPVIKVRPETKVSEALQVMMDHRIEGVPVVDDRNQVVGVLTYADLLRRVRRQHPRAMDFMMFAVVIREEDQDVVERVRRILDLPLDQICTHDVVTCLPDDHVADVAGLMVDHRIKRVPVVSAQGVLIGIVTRSDIMRAIWQDSARPE
jgi:CBS domain-containing protein